MNYVVKSRDGFYSSRFNDWFANKKGATRFNTREDAARTARSCPGARIIKLVPRTLRGQVAEFQAMIGDPSPDRPSLEFADTLPQRIDFIQSEVNELEEALAALDFPEIVDALADIAYFVEGTFQRLGVDSGSIMAEVHRSNMAKRGAGKDANGKWRKPPGWMPPDIAGELRKQGWRGGVK